MTDPGTLTFLPWLRSGSAGAIASPDPLTGPVPASVTVHPWLRIAGFDEIGQDVGLYGPGHVGGLGAATVTRRVPEPGTPDAEPNYFPCAEVTPADLPWRFTPAAPGARAQLRPWLVLVVVRDQEGVSVGAEPGAPLPVLRIQAPALPSRELPDLADSAAWVHIQSTVDAEGLPSTVAADPSVAVARLLCPRRLDPGASWIGCLVPAFDLGVLTGLGTPDVTAPQAEPAWDVSDPDLDRTGVRLPVYDTWRFGTGPDGDFESLARRLAPDAGDTVLGRADLDVTRPGPPLPDRPGRAPVRSDLVGALRSPGVTRRGARPDAQAWLDRELARVVDLGARRATVPAVPPSDYRPERDDPVVAPPLYAQYPSGRDRVPPPDDPDAGWLGLLNLRPELRALAGIGARVVRANAEALMASAWAQAGAVREAGQEIDHAKLSTEATRSLARRLAGIAAAVPVLLTTRLHPWIAWPDGGTLARSLRTAGLPAGMFSAAYLRATRPSRPLARAFGTGVTGAVGGALAAPVSAFLSATAPAAGPHEGALLRFARAPLPSGAWIGDPALANPYWQPVREGAAGPAATFARTVLPELPSEAGVPFDGTAASARAIAARFARRVPGGGAPVPDAAAAAFDVSGAAAVVAAGLDPSSAAAARLAARIPALAPLLSGGLPDGLRLSPAFTDPVSRDVIRLDPRLLLPGVDKLPANRVALLETDADYVAAVLAGANQQMARELIWREFPADPAGTFLARFWDSDPDAPDDIAPIAAWDGTSPGANVTGRGARSLTVILVRADLLARYPDAHVYLVRAAGGGDGPVPDDDHYREAVLLGRIDRRTRFYGFDLPLPRVRGDDGAPGWFVAVEQAPGGTRFGLDAAAGDGSDLVTGATAWEDLTWGHLVPPGGSLADVGFAVARDPLPARTHITGDPRHWGHNSAHQAAITYQRPFRVLIHASRLLPARRGPGGTAPDHAGRPG